MFNVLDKFSELFPEVEPMAFYRFIFPKGSFEEKGIYEPGKYNGIVVEVTDEKINGKQKILRHTVTDDLAILDELLQRDNFCIMSPISYIGKSRKSDNARLMYAMAIDVDGIVNEKCFNVLMKQIENGENLKAFVWGLPKPTFLVASGTGVHIYYVFEQPIPLFPNIVTELEKLKKRLTWQAWTQGASVLHDNVQYESLFQGFRVVGTITKKKTRTRAFLYGEKVDIEYLNSFVPKEYQATEFTYKSNLTLQQAKKKYPDWYEKRIVQRKPKGTWTCNRALYDWWIGQIKGGATEGHRYWCVMTLATYAKKCAIPYEELVRDSIDLLPFLNSIGGEFTLEDTMHALEAYNDSYMTYPIDTIVNRTDIKIEKNKRNGRKQKDHVKLMNFVRDEINGNKDWRNKDGRPKGSGTKERLVKDYAASHPAESVTEIARTLGVSRPTVYKYLGGKSK